MANSLTSKRHFKTVICCAVLTFLGLGTMYQSFKIVQFSEVNCNGCLMKYPASSASQDSWLAVDDTLRAYVFSAYYEASLDSTIRIIGIKNDSKLTYYCQLWYRHGTNLEKVETKATYNIVPAANFRYCYCNFICQLPNNTMPEAVSLVTKKCSIPNNVLKVKYIKAPISYERQFTVCVSPLHNNYSNVKQLIEWLELNKILGAQKFVVYKVETTETIDLILDEYATRNETEVIKWNIPSSSSVRINYFGQTVALNDCLYRNKGISEYVVNIDVDEFIIPHKTMKTWNEIIQRYPQKGAYVFSHTSFVKPISHLSNLSEATLNFATQPKLETLLNNIRENKVWEPPVRTKYIGRSKSIQNMRVHNPDMLSGQYAQNVKPEVGLLHHYRSHPIPSTLENITDNTVETKYKKDLIKHVAEIWSTFKGVLKHKRDTTLYKKLSSRVKNVNVKRKMY